MQRRHSYEDQNELEPSYVSLSTKYRKPNTEIYSFNSIYNQPSTKNIGG